MAGSEDQAEEVVADVFLDRGVEFWRGPFLDGLELATDLLVLPFEPLLAAPEIDRPVLRRGHEPGARVVRDARFRPPLERGDQSVLRQILGQSDIANDPRESGDESCRLDPPDRVDRAPGFGCCHGDYCRASRSTGAS